MAQAEMLALLETYSVIYTSPELDERLLTFSISHIKGLKKICQRAAFSHYMLEIYKTADNIHSNLDTVLNSFIKDFNPLNLKIINKNQGITFSVRFRLIGKFLQSTKDIKSKHGEYAAKLGAKILHSYPFLSVDLSAPMVEIEVLITSNKVYCGKILFKVNRSRIKTRTPSQRIFFHPASMNPFIVRAMLNLSNLKEDNQVFDPFVGAGGVALEALDMGMKVLCGEINPKMLYGARVNVEQFFKKESIKRFKRILLDATAIPLQTETIQAIVTDPPYGINASLGGKQIENLLEKAIHESYRVLKLGGRLIMCAPLDVPLEDYAKKTGFKEIRKINWYVHRSLTRKILVLEK
ncbi:MAG: hypothetical protein ACFFBD_08555 [Candidatus Hodarchaeota archaeon]